MAVQIAQGSGGPCGERYLARLLPVCDAKMHSCTYRRDGGSQQKCKRAFENYFFSCIGLRPTTPRFHTGYRMREDLTCNSIQLRPTRQVP